MLPLSHILLIYEILIQLGVWGKILVLAVGASFVVFSVLVAACFLGPGCWGYNCLNENQMKARRKSPGVTMPGGDFLLSDVGSAAVVTIYNINSSFRKTPVHCRQSVCSSISEASLTSCSNASFTSVGFMPLPTVSLIFQYVQANPGRLIIFLRHLDGLPGKDFPHHTEVITELKLAVGTNVQWSAVSRAIRNTRSPEYNSEFSLPANVSDLQKWCLTVTAYDKDRFNGYKELATTDMFMRDLIPTLQTGELIRHASLMTSYKKEYGNLLIGLSFLPTAQRLTISLVKAANLTCLQDMDSKVDFKPFARVFMLDGTGKVIHKKKLEELGVPECARHGSFNSVMTMQVTAPQMVTATLLIILCYKTKSDLASQLESAAKNSTIDQIARDGYVGRVAMGNLVTGVKERRHWQVMQERYRRVVTAWHVLH